MIAAGIRFHRARVDCKTLAFDEGIRHACCNDALKNVAQDVTLAKALKTVE
jgi:hypothetical protein